MQQINLLLALLDQAYDHKAWHGTNLRGSIRGIDVLHASWRPAAGRHNIWELTVHAAYWKYTVRRRILGEKRGSFPYKGSNWFERPSSKNLATEWRADRKLLDDVHASLRAAVAGFDEGALKSVPRGSRFDYEALIMGAASHDLYHAGQIQLIKRLMRRR